MKWRMESTSGLVPSKTLSSIVIRINMVSADFFNVEMRLVLLIVYYMFYSLLVNQE